MKKLLDIKPIELNEQFRYALDLLEHSAKNLFITGKAGTGKSTLLAYFRNHSKKKMVVLAPTGVAALNVQGQTIHSFFKFKPNVTLTEIKRRGKKYGSNPTYKNLEAIVIDEVSMLRADLLDCIDLALRFGRSNLKVPFGGVQMIFIGDLYQLPPVVSSKERFLFDQEYKGQYFFDAKVIDDLNLEMIELEKIYRQKDADFIKLLNSIRNNSIEDDGLAALNKRFINNFFHKDDDFYIYLTTTNKDAERINEERMAHLQAKLYRFEAEFEGEFDQKTLPTSEVLRIKIGAQIMLLNNDSGGRWVNGTIGKIVGVEKDKNRDEVILVERDDGKILEVRPFTWEMFHFSYDYNSRGIISEVVGTYTQYPLKLAWAVTIHKSQGKTFDKVIIDIGKGTFSHGQMYVALSRCTNFEGLVLKMPIKKHHIIMDFRVVRFLTRFRYDVSEKKMPLAEKMARIKEAIKRGRPIRIEYLKSNDEKSERVIEPIKIGRMSYNGKDYMGVEGYCRLRNDARVFRLDRILEIKD